MMYVKMVFITFIHITSIHSVGHKEIQESSSAHCFLNFIFSIKTQESIFALSWTEWDPQKLCEE